MSSPLYPQTQTGHSDGRHQHQQQYTPPSASQHGSINASPLYPTYGNSNNPLHDQDNEEYIPTTPHKDLITPTKSRYNDKICAIIFLLQFICGIVFGSIFIYDITSHTAILSILPGLDSYIFTLCGICIPLTILITLISILLLRSCSIIVIWCTYLFTSLSLFSFGYMLRFSKVLSISLWVLSGITILLPFIFRKRIQFTSQLFKISITSLFELWGIFISNVILYIIMIISTILMILSIVLIGYQGIDVVIAHPALAYVLFSFCIFWTSTTLLNISFTTTCGAVGAWWYLPDEEQRQQQYTTTASSFRRAITTSLGSIAFASLFLAIISLLRIFFIKPPRLGRGPACFFRTVLCCCCICIGCCLDKIFRLFQYYSLVYVALYGDTFISAAYKTGHIMTSRGITALVHENMSNSAVSTMIISSTLLSSILSLYALDYLYPFDPNDNATQAYTIIIFIWISYITSSNFIRPVKAAITTTFVVYAEDPQSIKATRPSQYNMLYNVKNAALVAVAEEEGDDDNDSAKALYN